STVDKTERKPARLRVKPTPARAPAGAAAEPTPELAARMDQTAVAAEAIAGMRARPALPGKTPEAEARTGPRPRGTAMAPPAAVARAKPETTLPAVRAAMRPRAQAAWAE